MFLKNLELVGFKSFNGCTKLDLSHGMTAIVGPNGCGKSNIADAIHWVLGEQSAKALRASKMEDCIFNGTENRPALGMAEVSLTLADCEELLGTEYHEVTITRRVFRSGEGQYFINKTPCRLKDIQRMFMDTGVGANSYSMMEQGRIDLVLSSHPEDRRAIFEEASGITKYKADKRETLRKLEQTEANLLRLSDIIKEVKRQIISLQRQAGKAARLKKFKDELRGIDLFSARERMKAMEDEQKQVETQMARLNEIIEAIQNDIDTIEGKNESLRSTLSESDNRVDTTRQNDLQMKTQLERAQNTIEINESRINEFKNLINNDTADSDKATRDLENLRKSSSKTQEVLGNAEVDLARAEKEFQTKSQLQAGHEEQIDKAKQAIEKLHEETLENETRHSKLQNELNGLETEDRVVAREREHHEAEVTTLKHVLQNHEKRSAEHAELLRNLGADAKQAEDNLNAKLQQREALVKAIEASSQHLSETTARAAACKAQLGCSGEKAATDAGGLKEALDKSEALAELRQAVLGTLGDQIEITPKYKPALAAVLHSWLDALVIEDLPKAIAILQGLKQGATTSMYLLAADLPTAQTGNQPAEIKGKLLLDEVRCPPRLRPLAERLLSGVVLIDSLGDLPGTILPQATYVTTEGIVVSGNGAIELTRDARDPRRLQTLTDTLKNLGSQRDKLQAELDKHRQELRSREEAIQQARSAAEQKQLHLARQEGENQVVIKQIDQVRENMETVSWELRELNKRSSSVEQRSALINETETIRERRGEIKVAIDKFNQQLRSLEQEFKHLASQVMEANVKLERQKQNVEHLLSQQGPISERVKELEELISGRSTRLGNYNSQITNLKSEMTEASRSLPTLQDKISSNAAQLEELSRNREECQAEWKNADEQLKQHRKTLEEYRQQHGEFNTKNIQVKMRHQNLTERITADYRLSIEAIMAEPEPDWPDGTRPDTEAIENMLGELRAKIDGLGSVYEGAIDEYKQLEERYTFLSQQQDDLVKSKQQLMDMIKKINQTSIEMFAKTFATINDNFNSVFKQLFGGGSAKVMLADEDDVLESGIEIIAKPPGKKLQSISLLSGGERTMTAVALLFAIYMVKPSPFCVLDEMDAALDEANIRRFIKILQGFLQQSQFIVITHNRQTISAANIIYGITMEENGISKIVSMKFSEQQNTRGAPHTPAQTAQVEVAAAVAAPQADGSTPQESEATAEADKPAS